MASTLTLLMLNRSWQQEAWDLQHSKASQLVGEWAVYSSSGQQQAAFALYSGITLQDSVEQQRQ